MQPRFCYNKRAQETLAAFVNGGRFPHALLLEGPEGSGRRTFAREIAAALFCRGEHKPCGSCNQCRKVLEQNHPDVEYYGGDGSRRSFHIDTIRQLRQNAWLLPGEAPCRVCVLCGAENMTDQAQNALLKILEEPPEHTVFILTAENRAMLLPTILSRVQTIPGKNWNGRQKQRIPLVRHWRCWRTKACRSMPSWPSGCWNCSAMAVNMTCSRQWNR